MNTIGNPLRFFKVTGELCKDKYDFKAVPWRLLHETQRYYEIKPENGSVKRIYKEKLNTTVIETKQYCNGTLSCSAFCTEDRIEDLRQAILEHLHQSVESYIEDLQLNQLALKRHISSF
ncbi:hypothetical protein [Cohnella boryungensis]|jgi:hypothetical protein|uniref:Uncharacterized protein n=1 Tax=Cohnella boryungensis TaxID=768479 RepID=A0ABV8SC98_9BACL